MAPAVAAQASAERALLAEASEAACTSAPEDSLVLDLAPVRVVEAPRSLVLSLRAQVERTGGRLRAVGAVPAAGDEAAIRHDRLAYSGRAWPFALAATADAATTYWAMSRGAVERNPFLGAGRLDVGMIKIAQFPLLAMAVDRIEARDAKLGRRLRWATLAFHALLAVNNVRTGHAAGRLGLAGSRVGP